MSYLQTKKVYYCLLVLLVCSIYTTNCHSAHSHSHHSGNHTHTHTKNIFSPYIKTLKAEFNKFLSGLSKQEQSYLGAFISSVPSIPIMLLLLVFRVQSLNVMNILSSFAAGSLIGDVFLHNLPEIFHEKSMEINTIENIYLRELVNFLLTNQVLICLGLIIFFLFEKLVRLFIYRTKKTKKEKVDSDIHSHSHTHDTQTGINIIICLIGDTLHNVTDGLAIAAAFSNSQSLGVSLVFSIFFHEIPHEVGDFSYLLKQKMSVIKAFSTQVLSAGGAFLGVYLNFIIGEQYSTQILAFASGSFLFIAVNNIFNDLKDTKSVFSLVLEVLAMIFGVYLMKLLC